MRYAYDLHLHTALSPCAEDDMTPNNVVNMAHLKGLDIIAITDHNTVKNCRACIEVGAELPILVIPGMELQTREDVHVLCYFPTIEQAEAFEKAVDAYRMQLPNKPSKFGNQVIMDAFDGVVGEYPYALIASLDIALEQVVKLVNDYDGVAVPAHLDRTANSVLSNLGFMPPDLQVNTIEVSKRVEVEPFLEKHPMIQGYAVLRSSDAHTLGAISERESFMDIEGELTVDSVLEIIRG